MEICGVSWDALENYQQGEGDDAARAELAAHLAAGCSECCTRLDWLNRVARAVAAPPVAPAPAAWQRDARDLFRDRMRQPARRPWPLIARLLFEGRTTLAFARGEGGQAASLHRIFAAAGYEIHVWEEKEPGGTRYVIGQVLPAQPSPESPAESFLIEASLVAAGQEAAPLIARLEENEFHWAGVPAGTYLLTLTRGGETIRVPEITIGANTSGTNTSGQR